MTVTYVLPKRLIELLKKEDVAVKELAEACYWSLDEMMSSDDLTLNAAMEELKKLLAREGVPKGNTTLNRYYKTIAWLFAERGRVEWVQGCKFNQHWLASEKARFLGASTYHLLVPGTFIRSHNGVKKDGSMSMRSKLLDLATRTGRIMRHVEVDVDPNRGSWKRQLQTMLEHLGVAKDEIDEALGTIL